MAYIFPACTLALLLLSLAADRKRTLQALRIAGKRFMAVLPSFVSVLLLTSAVLGIVSTDTIRTLLGGTSNRWIGTLLASAVGSLAVMPGFVAFPLGGLLRNNGVPYMVISAFTTTLMMVGAVTFPIERDFLGTRVALVRNLLGLLTAVLVALATGLAFGEAGL